MFFGPFLTKFLSQNFRWMHLGKTIRVWRGVAPPLFTKGGGVCAYPKCGTALMFQESFLKKIDKRSNISVERGVLRRE